MFLLLHLSLLHVLSNFHEQMAALAPHYFFIVSRNMKVKPSLRGNFYESFSISLVESEKHVGRIFKSSFELIFETLCQNIPFLL